MKEFSHKYNKPADVIKLPDGGVLVVTKDEILKSDYLYDKGDGTVFQPDEIHKDFVTAKTDAVELIAKDRVQKIIASNYSTLTLPIIPKHFIQFMWKHPEVVNVQVDFLVYEEEENLIEEIHLSAKNEIFIAPVL